MSKLDDTRGIYHLDPEDMEFNETMTNARKKLELQVDSAMLCKLRKTSGMNSLTAPKDPQEKICDEHEEGEVLCTDHTKKNKTVRACTSEAHQIHRKVDSRELRTKILKITLQKKSAALRFITILCTNLFPRPKQ